MHYVSLNFGLPYPRQTLGQDSLLRDSLLSDCRRSDARMKVNVGFIEGLLGTQTSEERKAIDLCQVRWSVNFSNAISRREVRRKVFEVKEIEGKPKASKMQALPSQHHQISMAAKVSHNFSTALAIHLVMLSFH